MWKRKLKERLRREGRLRVVVVMTTTFFDFNIDFYCVIFVLLYNYSMFLGEMIWVLWIKYIVLEKK